MAHGRSYTVCLFVAAALALVGLADSAPAAGQQPTYGFYLHVFREAAAVVQQLRDIKRFYPEAPVYIMSDGGANFTQACRKLIGEACHFEWRPPAHDCWNPRPFLDRFRDAALWLNTEFVVMLEPDVTLHRRATTTPQYDAGGLEDVWNPQLSQQLRDHLTELGRQASGKKDYQILWPHFGLAGGTAVRTKAAIAAFKAESVDWFKMSALDDKKVFSSDVAMAIALAANGFTYGPWGRDLTTGLTGRSNQFPNGTIKSSAFEGGAFQHHGADEHGGKPLYGRSLKDEDHLLVEAGPPVRDDQQGDTYVEPFCQHCMWHADGDCIRGKCPLSQPELGVQFIGPPFSAPPADVLRRDLLANRGVSKKLVVTTLIQDPDAWWGADFGVGGGYPGWAHDLFRVNLGYTARFNHTHIVRPHLTERDRTRRNGFSRFASWWEKFQTVLDYLQGPKFSHVLFLDADAVVARPHEDVVARMAEHMDSRGLSLLLGGGDMRDGSSQQASPLQGAGGSVLMARNTPQAKALLKSLVAVRPLASEGAQDGRPANRPAACWRGGGYETKDARLCFTGLMEALSLPASNASGALVQGVESSNTVSALGASSTFALQLEGERAGHLAVLNELLCDLQGEGQKPCAIVHFGATHDGMLQAKKAAALFEKARGG
eukprot:TRINITY_DN121789_c0_g1_i1.p1 TRINITY_DN121789_c0_g1~~TRINITY_DN121789_c0_g1_i1.p1  ORF type:complete len:658 (-),score=113.17 TRINITY_DN121789_c0_g1_i1:43-2016(-)